MSKTLIAVLFQCSILLAQSGTASVQGTVSDATTRKPVAGAFVTAVRSGLPAASQYSKTAADGSFDIEGLPAGDYSVCIQVPGDGYLDTCQWKGTPTKLTLAAGQKSTGNSLKIGSGSVLVVRIDDPNQLLNQKTKDGRDPHLMAGVWAPGGMFYPVRLAAKDATGVTYHLTVPLDSALKLNVISKDLKLSDGSGAALSAAGGDQQQFQHNTGDASPKSFRYTVTGLAQ